MSNTREFLNRNDEQECKSLVDPKVEVRDSLGTLAVQVLASRPDFPRMKYPEMLEKLLEIVEDLHTAFDKTM